MRIRLMAVSATLILGASVASCSSGGVEDLVGAEADAGAEFPGVADLPEGVPSELADIIGSVAAAQSDADAIGDDATGDDDAESDRDMGDRGEVDAAPPAEPLTFLLPDEGVTPDGWQRVSVRCEAAADSDRAAGWIGHAFPADWKHTGVSSGSGSPLNDSTGRHFEAGTSSTQGHYTIEFQADTVTPDGTITGHDGEPWESFDYTITLNPGGSDEEIHPITFEPVTTVRVGDQDVEIFVAPQEQDPEVLRSTVYRARFQLAQVPDPIGELGYLPASSVISIEHDATNEHTQLTIDIVADIVASLELPACAVKMEVMVQELSRQQDMDGDGHVTTPEDYQKFVSGDGS